MTKEKLATAVELSKNKKLGIGVSATYSAQQSCPNSCAFKPVNGVAQGCYANYSTVAFTSRKLNAAGRDANAMDVALCESAAIDRLSGRFPLRLHVVGDAPDDACSTVINSAARRFSKKHDQPVWGYSHAWQAVSATTWPDVAMRASCETPQQLDEAHALGWESVLVVDRHPEDGKSWKLPSGRKVVPCPEQTRSRSCVDCRLCWSTKGITISFAVHGQGEDIARSKLGAASS